MNTQRPNQLPVFFFAFANDLQVGGRYLRELPEEKRQIEAALKFAERTGLCEIISKSNVTLPEIFDTFQDLRYRDRIAIFHFGGHADSFRLLLEAAFSNPSPAYSEGLVKFLGRQEGLELIFLNGCNTYQQATTLLENGASAVIGTIEEVADEIARMLAVQFYRGLGEALPLEMAWKQATDYIQTAKGSNLRGLYRKERAKPISLPPWILQYRDGAAEIVKKWNLPEAAKNPFFGLPKVADRYDLPHQPYRFLSRYERGDARVFFGRGRKIRELYFRVTDGYSEPVILFSGQSGVGKSSLLEAGILPRLEETHRFQYIRREPKIGLLGALKIALFQVEKKLPTSEEVLDENDLLKMWKHLEQGYNQSLLIIIDQAEGLFNRPSPQSPDELVDFLQALASIFNTPSNRPQGKLILSYRKEYHSDFEQNFKSAKIPFEPFTLERFQKTDIIEVIEGLTSNEALQRKYQLSVQPNLAARMADELLVDKDSPIAPILQIILTKLWKGQASNMPRYFTIEEYQSLKEEGILLQDFYEQQMQKIQHWDVQNGQDAVGSGLALDILSLHTKKWQFAESRSLEFLQIQYEHRKDVLEVLLQQFDTYYLLTYLSDKQTTLAHDTLAPIIQEQMKVSDLPGQKARRILEAKMLHFNQDKTTIIEPEDLALVEAGQNGMRVWTLQENTLVTNSRTYRDKIEEERRQHKIYQKKSEHRKKRDRRLLIGLSMVIGVVGLWFGFFANRTAKINSLVAKALKQEKTDPTLAFKTIQEAAEISPENASVIQTRHDIYSNNEFYDKVWSFEESITQFKVGTDGNIVVAFGNKVQFLDENRQVIWETTQGSEILCVDISSNGEQILIVGKEGVIKIFDKEGRLINRMTEHKTWVRSALFLPNEEKILLGNRNGNIFIWNILNDSIQIFDAHTDEVCDLAFSETNNQFVSVSWDGTAKLWSLETGFLAGLPIEGRGLAAAFSANGIQIAIGDRNGILYIFDSFGQLQTKIQAHDFRINTIQFVPNYQMIVTGSDDKTIKLWNTKGNLQKTYRGHSDYVYDIALNPTGNGFYSASKDKTLKEWRIESKVSQIFGEHENEVSDLAISEDGTLLISASGSGKQAVANQINDPNFNFFDAYETPLKPQNAYIWYLNTTNPPDTLRGHRGGISAVAINQKAGLILTASEDSTALFWDLKGNLLTLIIQHQAEVRDVAFSKNGEWFATASYDHRIQFGNTKNLIQDSIKTLTLTSAIEAIDFSCNNQYLLVGQTNSEAILFALNGKEIRRFSKNKAAISTLAFSPDGEHLIIGDANNEAILYSILGDSLKTFRISQKTKTGAESVEALAFSPDGHLIALGGLAGIVEIIEIAEERVLWTLDDLWREAVHEVVFSRDDEGFFVGGRVVRRYELR